MIMVRRGSISPATARITISNKSLVRARLFFAVNGGVCTAESADEEAGEAGGAFGGSDRGRCLGGGAHRLFGGFKHVLHVFFGSKRQTCWSEFAGHRSTKSPRHPTEG